MSMDAGPSALAMAQLSGAKVAIVHDALVARGGAERVVLTLSELFPDAPIYTSVYSPKRTFPAFSGRDIRTSFLQRFCSRPSLFRAALPLYPIAFKTFDLTSYDLVVSSSAHWAKGVVVRPPTLHVCYCYTPSRIAWALDDYLEWGGHGPLVRAGATAYGHFFRRWDVATASRVDAFIAMSQLTAARIWKFYRRRAEVLPPPLETGRFTVVDGPGEFFLVVARLNAYKRVDLTIEAFNELGLPLMVVGEGPMRRQLQRKAGPNVSFAGAVKDSELPSYYARCRALVVACEEDFGLAALEAQASGRPVVAFARGGALETVLDRRTGVLFEDQNVDALKTAVLSCAQTPFNSTELREHAAKYDVSRFKQRFVEIVSQQFEAHRRAQQG